MNNSQLITKFKTEKRVLAQAYVWTTQDEVKERDLAILAFAQEFLVTHPELITVDSMGSPARVVRQIKGLYNVS